MKRKVLAILLASAMAFGLASCDSGSSKPETTTKAAAEKNDDATESEKKEEAADTGEDTKTSASSNEDVVELEVLSLPANSSGVLEGWWADEVEKAVGVRLNLIPSGDQGEQKLQALMASGDLPDIVVFKDHKQLMNAVEANMLLSYDDYKDQLPNLYNNAPISLQYHADNLSAGQDKPFAVSVKVKTDLESKGDMGPYIRYDLYKEVGAPEIKDLDDLLDVLEKMQESNPENEDGQKVYSLSFWKDWDRAYMTLGMFTGPTIGAKIPDEASLAEIHYADGKKDEIVSILSEGSAYLKFLKFSFEANQRGLLDPDSISQRFDDAVEKTKSGRVLLTLDGWGATDFSTVERENEGVGFRPILMTGSQRLMGALKPVGDPWSISVSASTNYADEAMAFVNWHYSYDGARTRMNGPKGVMWDVDETGKPYLTERYYEYQLTPDEDFTPGRNYAKGSSQLNAQAFWGSTIDPETGWALDKVFWEKPSYAPPLTKLKEEWKEDHDGAEDLVSYMQQDESRYRVETIGIYPSLTDEMEKISARAGDIIKTISWKMVFAKDEAEYNSLLEQMISDTNEVGIQDFVDWYAGEYEKNVADAEKYAIK